MKKRLTDEKRAALESKFKKLKQVRALFDEGKAANIVDKVSPEETSIQGAVEKLMSLMQAEPGMDYKVSKAPAKVASKKVLEALVRKAFEETQHEADESPVEEAQDLENPILHPVEDLEHEVQTMDDAHLTQEVEQLEDDLKDKMFSNSPHAEEDTSTSAPAAPALAPEQKMALLMSLPKAKRIEKAANLRALADALEMRQHEVSQNNDMHGNPNDALAHDYEDEEEGSMKDTGTKQAALKLKATLRQLITASEEVENEDEEKEDEKDGEKTAVLKLALRHLLASVEDMEEKEDEKDDKEDGMEKEAGEMPPWLDKEEDKEEKEDEAPEEDDKKEPSLDEKRAILRARLATLRNSKTASVDGKTMKTPKEVPSPSGTTEDQLKGDAKIQYSTALGESGLEEVHERRQKVPTDKEVAGTDEPNELYFANRPLEVKDRMTSEKDSSPDVNNKRVLKDEGTAVFNNAPTSPTDHMLPGAGSHQNPKDWEKAKAESDVTPGGERLKGLAELIQMRTERAMKLASKMADAGQIKTAAQLQEQVIKLATLEDDVFEKVAEVFALTVPMTKKAELPESFKDREGDPEDKKPPFDEKDKEDDDSDMEDDENPFAKKVEARRIRRQASKDEDDYGTTIRSSRTASRGINKALNLMSDIPTAAGSAISEKLSKIAWNDAQADMERRAEIDRMING